MRGALTERIRFNTELLKLLSLLLVATATGVISLILGGIESSLQFIVTLIGLWVLVGFGILIIFVYRKVVRLLDDLDNQENV